MQRVIVIGFKEVQTLDVMGPAEVFAAVERRLGKRAYDVRLASVGGGPRKMSSGIHGAHRGAAPIAAAAHRSRLHRRR